MLVSLNFLWRWLIQLSPFTAVTGSSLLLPPFDRNDGESSTKITTRVFIDVIDQDVLIDAYISCSLCGSGGQLASAPALPFLYLLRVKSALVSPDTATGLDWFLAPSCQAITV